MNKELYIKKENTIKRERQIFCDVSILKEFLKDNEKNFKEIDSINALKNIKNYLVKKQQELKETEKLEEKLTKELSSSCKHEIAIKDSRHTYGYYCLICKHFLTNDDNIIPNNALISIDAKEDYQAFYIIENTFKEIVCNDKDLIETISELVENMQYDRNIKVYRSNYEKDRYFKSNRS